MMSMNHSSMVMNNTMTHHHDMTTNMSGNGSMSGHDMHDNHMMTGTMDHSDMSGHDGHNDHMGHDMHSSKNISECLESMDALSIIWISINIIILLCTIPLMYKFIKTHFQKQFQKKQPSYLFYPGLLFAISTFVILIADTIVVFFYECNHFWWMIFMLIFGFTYTLQIILVLTIFFTRTYFIFKTSAYSLSKVTIIIYSIIFIIIPCLIGCVEAWYHMSHHSVSSSQALAACYALTVIVMISLLILFTKKLFKIYNTLPAINDLKTSETHSGLMKVITRTVVLTSISIIFTLIASIGFVAIDRLNKYGQMTVAVLVVIDVYTNFLCILLSYTFFDSYYNKLCGRFDAKTGKLCNYITGHDAHTLDRFLKKMNSVTSTTLGSTQRSNTSHATHTEETTTKTKSNETVLAHVDSDNDCVSSGDDQETNGDGIEIVSI